MTGLAAILPRGDSPAGERDLAPLLAAMGHPGAGAPVTRAVGGGAVGVLPFPADDGSDRWGPPLVHDPASGLTLLFDGRLDGRGLIDAIGEGGRDEARALAAMQPRAGHHARGGESVGPSDAMFVLLAWRRFGARGVFQWLHGPFALVLVDPNRRHVVLARDMMGTRPLAYALDRKQVVVASEAATVSRVAGVDATVDPRTMAHYFALHSPEDGATFYRGVRDLRPGELLTISLDEGKLQRDVVQPTDELRLIGGRISRSRLEDENQAANLRHELDEAVHERMPGVAGGGLHGQPAPRFGAEPFGITLSGGLDSASVAALAAAAIAPRRLPVFSYVFDDLEDCDERPWMDPLVERWGLDAHHEPAEPHWPLRDPSSLSSSEGPEASPYQGAMDAVYRAAATQGVSVLMAGAFGDHHYTGAEAWLADLWRAGRWIEGLRELARHVTRAPGGPVAGLRGVARSRSLRLALQALRRRGRDGYWSLPRQVHGGPQPPWLTPETAGVLEPGDLWPPELDVFGRPHGAHSILGVAAARGSALARAAARRQGIALRLPWRDVWVASYMLCQPAFFLYHHGRAKHGLRLAMGEVRRQRGGDGPRVIHLPELLPPAIRNRAVPTDQRPFYRLGVFERERETVRALLERPDARWREFVDPAWLAARVPPGVLERERRDGDDVPWSAGMPGTERDQAVVWRCITAELWRPS